MPINQRFDFMRTTNKQTTVGRASPHKAATGYLLLLQHHHAASTCYMPQSLFRFGCMCAASRTTAHKKKEVITWILVRSCDA
jgi:hypothetical protein